jgi:hypothetical protein
MLEAALQYGAACKRLVNCKLENANEQITAALFDEIKRLRAELAELRRFRKVIMDYDSNLYDALANSDAARKGEEE